MSASGATAATLPAFMRAVEAVGGRAVVNASRALPVLKPREVLVKVHYSAVNRADTLQRKGAYPPPPGASDVLGLELTGQVVALGPGCALPSKSPVGSFVMALVAGGGNAEYAAVHEAHL